MAPKNASAVTDTKPRPFDERTALDELERLAEKIQATRRQRERAVAEFNAFVKTFKDEDHAARLSALQPVARSEAPPAAPTVVIPAPSLAERRAAEPAPVAIAPAAIAPPAIAAPAIAPAAMVPAAIAVPNDAPPPAPEVPAQSRSVPASSSAPAPRAFELQSLWKSLRGRIGIAVVALVVVVLLASWLMRGGQNENAGEPPVAGSPAAAPAAQRPPASTGAESANVPTPVASTGAPRAVNVVLTTIRPVWTRVTVDDRKVIEREIPAAQTIPLGADRAIVIRVGDAGAIRLTLDGKDLGAMGRDGQIGSRTFTAPSAR